MTIPDTIEGMPVTCIGGGYPGPFHNRSDLTTLICPEPRGGEPNTGAVLPRYGSARNPLILDFGPSFGLQTNGFGFIISWATNANVVVGATTDLASSTWSAVSTNTLTEGTTHFTDAGWAKYAARFYRVRGE